MEPSRIQLIVYTDNAKTKQKMELFGHVVYISKKMNYVCLYIDECGKEQTINQIKKLHRVKKVEIGC